MNIVHAEYNKYHNIIDINYYNGYILRIDCGKAEDGLITTPNSQRMLDALAIDNPLEYARLYLDSEMQDWVIIPELSEPPVRTLGATIPENESHIFR